ncbi:hypothetical protein SPRG_17485, partial [Saprolegnia parasitica CBS 223.65]
DSDDSSSSTNLLMLSEVALQVKVESPLSSDDDLHSKAKTKLACYLKNETLYCPFV